MATYHTARDLANAVAATFNGRRGHVPSRQFLSTLFDAMYYSSLRTEEGRPIAFHIVYVDPVNPDPHPPKRIVQDRWSIASFSEPIPLTVQNFVKLALASDPRSSSLAVYDLPERPCIWGLVDQGNRYYDFVNYESDSGPERPGAFQASILGVGHLAAFVNYETVAELRISSIVGKRLDVFRRGPIHKRLEVGIKLFQTRVKQAVGPQLYGDRTHWGASLSEDWISAICRLLLRTQAYRHGGAFLITPDHAGSNLNVKFSLNYYRLRSALEAQGEAVIRKTFASDQIMQNHIDDEESGIPQELYLDESVNQSLYDDARSELDGALWFVSLLSRVDGLVLMDPVLNVRGFGVVITSEHEPARVFVARDIEAKHLRELDYNRYGTRHRSMMRYCSEHPASVGFVISQDGDVRIMTTVGKRLVVWENVKLQFYDFLKAKPTRA